MKTNLTILLLFILASCSTPQTNEEEPKPIQVELQTTKGAIVLELSDKTPQHRDNFVKLVEEGAYDSVLFHRVINDFVVQAGERDSTDISKNDKIRDYKVPAEFDSSLFHKRGALGAARDGNPERASSAIQFYIVQRGPNADSLIDKGETRINNWLANHYTLNAPENQALKNSLVNAMEQENWEIYSALNDSIQSLSESFDFDKYEIPEAHREIYRNIGGAPHLDQNYTVFGDVIKGMNVVDSIATIQVNDQGRPIEDVRIISAQIIK
ncbi:peptidylprolyl isomerase [Ekhidna sp.]